MRAIIFSCSVLMAALPGCGYTSGSLLPAGVDTVYVDNFENRVDPAAVVSDRRSTHAYRPNLETEIRTEVINRFMRDGHLRITDRDSADLVLTGALTRYEQWPLSYDDNDNVETMRIRITVDLELRDGHTGKVVWKESRFMGRDDYNLLGIHSISEEDAVRKAVEDLARRIVERTVEAW